MKDRPLIILGMHRSGTSVLSKWLNAMGLNLGNNLLGAGLGNVQGHFENLDILDLHEEILKRNQTDYLFQRDKQLHYIDSDYDKCNEILRNYKKNPNSWGWKEPRTSVMMDLWGNILDDYRVIVVYRDYNEVVMSLYNRRLKIYSKRRNILITIKFFRDFIDHHFFKTKVFNKYLEAWIIYNKKIIEHLEKMSKNNYLVVKDINVISNESNMFRILKENWEYHDLNFLSFSSIFKPELYGRTKVHSMNFEKSKIIEANKVLSVLSKIQEF